MPNHCTNRLTVIGSKEDIDAFVEKAKGHDPVYAPNPNSSLFNVKETLRDCQDDHC